MPGHHLVEEICVVNGDSAAKGRQLSPCWSIWDGCGARVCVSIRPHPTIWHTDGHKASSNCLAGERIEYGEEEGVQPWHLLMPLDCGLIRLFARCSAHDTSIKQGHELAASTTHNLSQACKIWLLSFRFPGAHQKTSNSCELKQHRYEASHSMCHTSTADVLAGHGGNDHPTTCGDIAPTRVQNTVD